MFQWVVRWSASDLLWMNNAKALVPREIIDIEGDDVFDAVDDHSCDDPCVMSLVALDGVSANQSFPLPISIFRFDKNEKDRLEACDVALDSRWCITKSVLFLGSRACHPEFRRNLRNYV